MGPRSLGKKSSIISLQSKVNMRKKKSTKVGAAKSEYRLYVEFKEEYQNPRASFDYYSNLGKTSDFQLRELKRRVLYGSVYSRYKRARLYRQATGECLGVWVDGLPEMTAAQYHEFTRERFKPEPSLLHAYVICRREYQEVLRAHNMGHPLIIFGRDKTNGSINKLMEMKNLYSILTEGKLKNKYAKVYIYDRVRDLKVAEVNIRGEVTILDVELKREMMRFHTLTNIGK